MLSGAELGRLAAAATGDYPLVWRFAAGTGLRSAELRGLVWGDVDLDAARVTVTRQPDHLARGERVPLKGKGVAERRTVPLTPDLVASLRDRRARQSEHGRGGPGDWVFTLANGNSIPADRFGSRSRRRRGRPGSGRTPTSCRTRSATATGRT